MFLFYIILINLEREREILYLYILRIKEIIECKEKFCFCFQQILSMNIMRKLRGGTSVGGMSSNTGGLDDCAGVTNPQHTALGLMHLKKLFSEYTHPPHPLSDAERDDKLYNMLPLFCKVKTATCVVMISFPRY